MRVSPRLRHLIEWTTAALIFLIPSNLFFKINESGAYVHGLLLDYLIPKIYVSDFPLVILLGIGLWIFLSDLQSSAKIRSQSRWGILVAALGSLLLFLRQTFTTHPLSAWWYSFKLIEMGLLGIFLTRFPLIFKSKVVCFSLVVTVLFQTFLGFYQFQTQNHFLGYYFLGEPVLTRSVGITHGTFNGEEKILPYGTTAHPNILAGTVVVLILIIIHSLASHRFFSLNKNRPRLAIGYGLLIISGFTICLMTQSWSAFLTLLIGLGTFSYQKFLSRIKNELIGLTIVGVMILAPAGLTLMSGQQPTNLSLVRRLVLNQASVSLIADNPWFGVGLNNFTPRVEEYGNFQEVVRFVQPVHHLGLLWISETGIAGCLVIIWLLSQMKAPTKHLLFVGFIPLMPIVVFDHYLLTTQTGGLLLTLWLAFNVSQSSNGVFDDRS